MKKSKKIIALVLIIVLAISSLGCSFVDNLMKNNNEKYIINYVTASLDVLYKGNTDKFVAIRLGSKDEGNEQHQLFLDGAVAGFLEGSEATDAEYESWRPTLEKMYGLVKYSVESATEREDGSFLVVISYEQYKVFENVLPAYEKFVKDNQDKWQEEYGNLTDAEFNSKLLEAYRQCIEDAVANPEYAETKQAEIVVSKNSDGLFEIEDETMAKIEALLIDTDYVAEYTEVPAATVTLGQYKGISVKRESYTLTDDDVDSEIYGQLASSATDAGHTKAEKWDVVTIDFEGKMNGEVLEYGSGNDYQLTLGTNVFIEGFEEGLIGVGIGETVDLNLKFPEDYGDEKLNGQDVIFTVTVKEIKTIPELTDDFIKAQTGYDTLAALRAYVRESLETELEAYIEEAFQKSVLTEIIKNATFDGAINDEITEYANSIIDQYKSYALAYSMSLEDFLYNAIGYTLETFYAEVAEVADFNVKCDKILVAIAEAEGFTVSDSEYSAAIQAIMESSSNFSSEADVIAAYGEEAIRNGILSDMALDFVLGNAVVIK